MGATATIATLAASAFSVYKSATAKPPYVPAPAQLPPAPNTAADAATAGAASAAAASAARRKAASVQGRSSTILTSPQGLGDATTERKTLLGL